MPNKGFHTNIYINDPTEYGLPSNIHNSFAELCHLFQELGLEVSVKNLVPPSTSVICLGVLIDYFSEPYQFSSKG